MNQFSLKIKQIVLKTSKDQRPLQACVEATLSVDDKDIDITFSEGILAYGATNDREPITITKHTQKYIKDILSAFVAGVTARTSLAASVPMNECDVNCKLED